VTALVSSRLTELVVPSERSLSELEAVIETAIATVMARFNEVGSALLEIRERHLYQERGYARFEDYCAERLDMSRPRAYQLMDAVAASTAMSTLVDIPLPAHERYVRELVPLAKKSPEAAAQVWRDVYEATNGRPHILDIRQAVQEQRRKEEIPTIAESTKSVDKTRDAVRKRRERMQSLAQEGYRDDQIADIVGLDRRTVQHQISDMGLPSQSQRIGKGRRIDHNRALSALIETCTPTPEVIAVIDWAQLDRQLLPEWDTALTSAIQTLTHIRAQVRKRITEKTDGH